MKIALIPNGPNLNLLRTHEARVCSAPTRVEVQEIGIAGLAAVPCGVGA